LAEEECDVVLVSCTAADLEAARPKRAGRHNVAMRCLQLDLSDSINIDGQAAECAQTEILLNAPRSPGRMKRAGAKRGI
jgi:short-subunit dehydrogenase